ncbi:hypothetical protein OF001_U110023 [Pseudomonas sp. OF001]|nr:hypothetical protein OF001_U110023 [Pseudomonas sp. OF001]
MQQRVDERARARRVPGQGAAEQALLLRHRRLHLGPHQRKLAAPDHPQHRRQQASGPQGALPRRAPGRLPRCADPGRRQRRRGARPGAVRRGPGARHAHRRGPRPDQAHADRRPQPDPEHRRAGRPRPDGRRDRHRAVDLARAGAGEVRSRHDLREELLRALRTDAVEFGRLGLQHRPPVGRRRRARAQPGQREPDQGPGRPQVPAAQGPAGVAHLRSPERADRLRGEGQVARRDHEGPLQAGLLRDRRPPRRHPGRTDPRRVEAGTPDRRPAAPAAVNPSHLPAGLDKPRSGRLKEVHPGGPRVRSDDRHGPPLTYQTEHPPAGWARLETPAERGHPPEARGPS